MFRKSLPLGTIMLILIVALAGLGVAYGLWSETLRIEGEVYTGEVDVQFSTYDHVECVDTPTGLCQPELDSKADVANCSVVWEGPDGDGTEDLLDDGFDLLKVTVTGMYPSWHCRVLFDVTSTGTVPVHVKHPVPTADSPPWVVTDFENCYVDGYQLHQGESTPQCAIDIHFTNEQAPDEDSGPYVFGWEILAHQWNEEPTP
jgi:hypothetical protein